ncbi:hypothetical protein [Bacillus altitudinis]
MKIEKIQFFVRTSNKFLPNKYREVLTLTDITIQEDNHMLITSCTPETASLLINSLKENSVLLANIYLNGSVINTLKVSSIELPREKIIDNLVLTVKDYWEYDLRQDLIRMNKNLNKENLKTGEQIMSAVLAQLNEVETK